MYRNGFGYPDPTAFQALSNIRREEKRAEREKKYKTNGKAERRQKNEQNMERVGKE